MGFADWAVDKEKEVTGVSHKGEQGVPKDYKFFTIGKEDGNEFMVGLQTNAQNGSNSKSRPQKLDEKTIFYKE